MLSRLSTASTPTASLPRHRLGSLLLDAGLITTQQLTQALEEQQHGIHALGSILVGLGILTASELQATLAVQNSVKTLEEAIHSAAGVRTSLGELLCKAKRLSPRQLELALQEHSDTGERLGAILVRNHWLSQTELAALLAFQEGQARAQGNSPIRLGEILVSSGQLSRQQLDDALACQQVSRKKLGEVLIEAGYAQAEQISRALSLQSKLLGALLIALLANSQFCQAEGSASASLTVSAQVVAHAKLKVMQQTSQVVIGMSDIKRGYVDIPAASRLEVKSNSAQGYMLNFESGEGFFKAVQVNGLGTELEIGPSGGWVVRPDAGRAPATLVLGYRFYLSDDIRPGVHPWPLSISVRPL